ncbi:PHP domain-containing protein [Bacillus sp. ISL-47]|uniref:PHP domain-containing protein n=1 Tax=Bacillus sp. ISL-47 TaxID=2819130 RepID=UPI001BE8A6A3|nr:PHP domain-containing protein [Bacillus sp. ISL-47]MBT2686901.1 PHP domain-containing protein [Bacillus sp. ISL-47]MBT2710440.1 PHP domain-containing protein [Pseudomonas sp. ISL-84]
MDLAEIIKKGQFDLHMHTTASDGVLSPSEIVEMAASKGITTIAITDHDTMHGIKEASEAGKRFGVKVIPGIELSTKYKGISIDILGHGIHESKPLLDTLQKIRDHRENRAQIIVKKFCELGMPITEEDVKKHSKGDVIARPHIAKAVVEKGYAENVQEVFDQYLADGKPCAVDKMVLSPEDGIRLIHQAGGLAVLAHPVLVRDDTIIEELLKLPVDGIEVWHRKQTFKDSARYKALADKYNKKITGGSDYHNEEHSLGEFGFQP